MRSSRNDSTLATLVYLSASDWLIDLGPEGGEGGGQIVAVGTPEDLRQHPDSHTAQALREYALGLESLNRAATGEPLWRVHEAVFAVLAMESEPVDPRL